jgi:hypothetical protein
VEEKISSSSELELFTLTTVNHDVLHALQPEDREKIMLIRPWPLEEEEPAYLLTSPMPAIA